MAIGLYCHHTARFAHNTGIQRCLRAIARALIEAGEELTPLRWDRDRADLSCAGPEERVHLQRWSGPSAQAWSDRLPAAGSWLLVVELLSGPHQPNPQWLQAWCSRRGWKCAALFHDAIPLGWGGSAAQHHSAYMRGLAELDLVLATSRTVAAQLQAFWREQAMQPRARLELLPLAAEITAVPRRQPTALPPADRPLRLLQVGSLEPRKNHRALLKALAWIQAQQPGALELRLIGWANHPGVRAQVDRARACGLPLIWEGPVEDQRLLEAYGQADLSVYPSLEEGFGLPVLESLWLGTPCLCTAVPALEVSGGSDGCQLLPSVSWRDLASELHALVNNPQGLRELRADLASRPLRSWSDLAQDLLRSFKG